MVNYRVNDLLGLLAQLKEQGIEPVGEVQVYDYGKFAHIMDPDGNKLELWEAADETFAELQSKTT
jgi:predicted enzyme related to lactoylglutathione lyase